MLSDFLDISLTHTVMTVSLDHSTPDMLVFINMSVSAGGISDTSIFLFCFT